MGGRSHELGPTPIAYPYPPGQVRPAATSAPLTAGQEPWHLRAPRARWAVRCRWQSAAVLKSRYPSPSPTGGTNPDDPTRAPSATPEVPRPEPGRVHPGPASAPDPHDDRD